MTIDRTSTPSCHSTRSFLDIEFKDSPQHLDGSPASILLHHVPHSSPQTATAILPTVVKLTHPSTTCPDAGKRARDSCRCRKTRRANLDHCIEGGGCLPFKFRVGKPRCAESQSHHAHAGARDLSSKTLITHARAVQSPLWTAQPPCA